MKKFYTVLVAVLLMVLAAVPTSAQADQTIVEIASGNDDFSTLVTAIEAAGLADTLSGEGPFTVFAPTNEAFEKLPAGLLDSLLADTDALAAVLTYHVVAGEVPAADVVTLDGESVATVQGEEVTIGVDGDAVTVNTANVVQTDIQASNGIIHVIDTVLVPPSIAATLEDNGAAAESAPPAATPAAPSTLPATGAADNMSYFVIGAGLLLMVTAFVVRRAI